MRCSLIVAFLAMSGALVGAGGSAETASPPPAPTIQIAVLLDTSGSMSGLLAQAKTQLWNIVNEFVRAKQNGRAPAIQVALFEYGKQSLPSSEGFVRLILPLTDDLDRVSEELFALATNGGEEYCGWAIRDAVNRLDWSPSSDVYKAIFIAGNEPFTQGAVNFQQSCKAAIERGILVNTIFCGPSQVGEQTGWKDGAFLADGRFMSIDQNKNIAEIAAPQDGPIAKLGIELNKTYLPYGGRMGEAGQARQVAQDSNAGASSRSVLVNRSISKANAFYCNDAWDLVDAIKNGKCNLEELNDDELPAELRKLDKAARKSKVDEAAHQRAVIQSRILELNKEREQFLAAERQKQKGTGAQSLDQVVTKAIRIRLRGITSSSSSSMNHKRILVVEDDPAIRRGLVDALSFAGYATLEASEGASGLATAIESDCDLLLLDLVLPGRDGLSVLHDLRGARSSLPVIVLTARGAEDDRVKGLGLGADDYVVKPFSIKELLARIEAVLRRAPARRPAVKWVNFNGGLADLERNEVRFDDGARCELSERERQLLDYLARHAGRVVGRDELLAQVWGLNPAGISTRTIDMHIARLRDKLHDDPASPRILLTVRGQGYMIAPWESR